MDATNGLIVRSKAGRDKGGWFVILWHDNDYALITNGDSRKVESPKRKKLKHLQLTGSLSEFIADKLRSGIEVTNSEVRTALAEYLEKQGGNFCG